MPYSLPQPYTFCIEGNGYRMSAREGFLTSLGDVADVRVKSVAIATADVYAGVRVRYALVPLRGPYRTVQYCMHGFVLGTIFIMQVSPAYVVTLTPCEYLVLEIIDQDRAYENHIGLVCCNSQARPNSISCAKCCSRKT